MENWKKVFTQKIGPVPVVYIGAVILVILAVVVSRTKFGQDTSAESDLTTSEEADVTADDIASADYGFAATRGTVTVSQEGSGTTSAAVVDTNDLWVRRAAEYLGGQGQWSTTQVQAALQHYIDGNDLSYDEGLIRDAAVKQFGLPPETVTPGATGKMPAKRQGNAPTTHTVKGSLDNTYTELAQLYYGKTDGDTLDLLQLNNKALGQKGPFSTGTKVKIPLWKTPQYFTATSGTKTSTKIASRHGISVTDLKLMNQGLTFPVKVGTKVHVGWK
ncbi:MAG TPA: hypothetical protein VJ553_00600 [Candidatus Paceibacterota bacterium]|nr:hypothetical protein [Candidatus Paceibacterota bacterium]